VFKCDAIGSSSDSQYCNPAYDKLYDEQNLAETPEARRAILEQMQNIIYDDAPYDILYYDSYLDAYRTDRFAGWQNQPANGIPLFTYSTLGYTRLTNAAAVASAEPSAAASSGTAPTASATPAGGDAGAAGSNTTMIIAVVVVVAVLAVGLLYLARRRGATRAEEE
jgi:peptide/nickel transport system substrate-binding protein